MGGNQVEKFVRQELRLEKEITTQMETNRNSNSHKRPRLNNSSELWKTQIAEGIIFDSLSFLPLRGQTARSTGAWEQEPV